MQSPKMTSLMSLFLVIAITSSIVSAAPTFAEAAVDENVENIERGLTDTEQQADVAEQEVQPAVQQGAVAKPRCITVCVGWGPFGACIRWGRRCYRDFNDGNAESANVQGSEVEQQEDIAAQEVQPLVQEGAVAGSRCYPWCKRYGTFGGCLVWGKRCSRGLDDVNAESANVQGSEVEQQQDVAEQEVQPAVQQGAVAKPRCITVCVGWGRNGVCISWGRRCYRGLNDGNVESANVQGSETEDKVDRSLNEEQQKVAEQEVLPEVQDAVVAPNRGCVKYCIGWTNRGKCYGWDWRC